MLWKLKIQNPWEKDLETKSSKQIILGQGDNTFGKMIYKE